MASSIGAPDPGAERVRLDRLMWIRCARAARNFLGSEVGGRGKLLVVMLIGLLLGLNALNVTSSYVSRDFMTAIAELRMAGFVAMGLIYVGVLAITTVVAVFYRFTEERLGLLWRRWLTGRLVSAYLDRRVYYRLREEGDIDNPDQRIAEDVRSFTVTTLSFALMFLNATFTIVAFSGVMWSISPTLFVVAVLYAGIGSALMVLFGRPLLWLNYNQSDKEASFRADLVHVGQNAESIALLRQEGRLNARLLHRLDELVANASRIIRVNRNLGFFTTGYNNLIQIIPALIVAPLFIRGQCEFGVIPQSAMAFSHLLGAFSLIVTQFQSLSLYAAVIARMSSLAEATEVESIPDISPFEMVEEGDRLAYEGLTLRSPRDGRVLVGNLCLSVRYGTCLLVVGANETAKVALFRATAGIWYAGCGRIIRPAFDRISFLPERPYLPPGTLREVLLRAGRERAIPDDRIIATLLTLGLESVLTRVGGIDVERDWDNALSLGEQLLVAVARILLASPRFVLLDRISTALEPDEVDRVLKVLSDNSISYVTFGKDPSLADRHDAVLELAADGSWSSKPTIKAAS